MEQQTKKTKKEAKGEKSKDQKVEEQILKSLEEAKTPEEKFQMLLSKYVENDRVSRRSAKQMEPIVREKENLQKEYNKSVLMTDKLEAVCREQQKLIKSVKFESMQKIREADERRSESQSRFLFSLNVINQQLNKNYEENNKLREYNIEMTTNLKYLAEQYQAHNIQLEKLNEQVQIELGLHRAKLSKLQVEAAIEKEILIGEKQITIEKLLHTQMMLKELTDHEEDN